MTKEQPKVKAASRYSTRETCALLGISRGTLIRRTAQGFITANRYKGSRNIFYTGLQITRLWNAIV